MDIFNINEKRNDNDKLVINAVVRGSEDYDVSIYFTAIQVHASTLWL